MGIAAVSKELTRPQQCRFLRCTSSVDPSAHSVTNYLNCNRRKWGKVWHFQFQINGTVGVRDQIRTFHLRRYTVLIKCSVATMQTSVLISRSVLACLCLSMRVQSWLRLRLFFVFTYCFKWWNYLQRMTEVRVTEASYIDLFVVLLLISCVLSLTNIT